MGDMSYEGYIRDFVLDPEYVKYLYENGHNKFARKVEKLALKEKEKLNEKKESKLESVFAKKVEEKKICINKEKMKIEEVTIKEELEQFIEVKENENQIVSLVKQESEVNEVLIPPLNLSCFKENHHWFVMRRIFIRVDLFWSLGKNKVISHSSPKSIPERYNWFLMSSLRSITFPQLLKFLT
jgi:hypothetical protein